VHRLVVLVVVVVLVLVVLALRLAPPLLECTGGHSQGTTEHSQRKRTRDSNLRSTAAIARLRSLAELILPAAVPALLVLLLPRSPPGRLAPLPVGPSLLPLPAAARLCTQLVGQPLPPEPLT
jgi:hypothetical protein